MNIKTYLNSHNFFGVMAIIFFISALTLIINNEPENAMLILFNIMFGTFTSLLFIITKTRL